MRITLSITALLICAALFFAFAESNNQDPDWKVPESYLKMDNPVSADNTSIAKGKTLYGQHCKSCHGKEGLGDGPKSAQLDTPSGDFTDPSFTEQSDGAIFYKTRIGRDDMPSFEKKIPYEEDIWHIVNYIRTME